MQHRYLLEWLDATITITLNPEKRDPSLITQKEADTILKRINVESIQIQQLINGLAFSGNDRNQLKQLIRQYHSSITLLIEFALKSQKHSFFKQDMPKTLNRVLLSCLDELLCFIENRFPSYLSLDERASAFYLTLSKRELRKRLDKSKPVLLEFPNGLDIFLMLTNRLDNLTNFDNQYDVSIQNILYKKELIRGLENLKNEPENGSEYSALDVFLIYLNFNSKAYINHLTQKISNKINAYENLSERSDQLLLHYKLFNQLHRKPQVILNPKYHSLTFVIGNWFQQEITYLEKKIHLSVIPLVVEAEASKPKDTSETEKHKVLCDLSTDQIALFLRASWDLKILVAKSMNGLFKSIVPSLSTPYKTTLSYDATRSKAYVAEERDKEILIKTLESVIQQIKKYN